MLSRIRLKNYLVILLFLCLTLVFFREIIAGEKILVTTDFLFFNFFPWGYYKPPELDITKLSYHLDVILEFYPLLKYASSQIKNLQLPLWNPYICSGLPFIAQPHISFLYPLNALFFLFPTVFAFGLCAIIHVFLIGLFTYLFLSALNVSRVGSLCGAIVFMFNGTTISLLFPDAITSICWMPLILYLFEMSISKRERLYSYLGGLGLGMAFLTGEVRFAACIGIFLFLYFIFRVFFMNRDGSERNFSCAILSIAVIYLIGLSAGAILLLPLFELLPLSNRLYMVNQGPNLNLGIGQTLSAFVFPGTIREPEFSIMLYVGFLTLFLCLFSFLKRNKISLFFALAASLFFFSANAHISNIISRIMPLFRSVRLEQEVVFPIVSFSSAIIAGIGFDNLFENFLFKQEVFRGLHSYKKVLRILVVVIITADLFMVGRNKLLTLLGDAKYCYFKTQATDFLVRDKELYRVMRMASDKPRKCFHDDILSSNTQMVYGIYDAQGYLSFLLQRYGEFMNHIEPGIYINEPGENFICGLNNTESLNSRLIDLANVKYILSAREIKNNRFSLVYDKEFKIYLNKNVLPRAFLVPRAKLIKDPKQILGYMGSDEFESEKEVILEEEPSLRIPSRSIISTNSRVLIERYEAERVVLNITADCDGWLVLSDTYYPGWKAYVDDKTVRIYNADYVFRAVEIKKGKHKVTFNYSPVSFKSGLYISIFTVIIALILIAKRLLKIKTSSS